MGRTWELGFPVVNLMPAMAWKLQVENLSLGHLIWSFSVYCIVIIYYSSPLFLFFSFPCLLLFIMLASIFPYDDYVDVHFEHV